MTNTNINSIGARLVGVDDPTRDDHAATKGYVDAHGGGGSTSVTDGSTTVTGLTELDFTSGATVTDAGGGVAQVAVAAGGSHERELLNTFTSTSIGAGSGALLPWHHSSGDTLLSLTPDETQPTIVTAGVYAVMITVAVDFGTPLTAGKSFLTRFDLDYTGDSVTAIRSSADSVAGFQSPEEPMCLVSYLPAGAVLSVYVTNNDSGAISFFIEYGIVQRIA